MKKFIATLCILLSLTPAYAQKQKPGVLYDAVITRVIDGDTVAFEAKWLPEPLKKELSIRVFGVDTPKKVLELNALRKKQWVKLHQRLPSTLWKWLLNGRLY